MSKKAKGGIGKKQGTKSPNKSNVANAASSDIDRPHLWVELDLKASKQATTSSNQLVGDIDSKFVLMHATDAHKVDIRNDEAALLISDASGVYNQSIEESDSLVAAVCKVKISAASTDFNPPGTRKTKDADGFVPQGEMRVMSPLLIEHLFSDTKSKPAAKSEVTTSSKTPEIASTSASSTNPSQSGAAFASPSKAKFSFAKGGGGDALISPSKSSTPSSAKHEVKWINSPNLTPVVKRRGILVPLHHLNKRQLGGLCSDALVLVLCPVGCVSPESKNAEQLTTDGSKQIIRSLSGSRSVIQTLGMAKYQGSYISTRQLLNLQSNPSDIEKHEVLSVVFRGQIESFYIADVISKDETHNKLSDVRAELSTAIDGLSLSDTDTASTSDDLSNQSKVLHKILEKCHNNSCSSDDSSNSHMTYVAYNITPRTQIRFVSSLELETNVGVEESLGNPTNVKNSKLCAGLDATLRRIGDALLPPILHPNLFPADGPLRPPKGVLLFGPAGVGKSLVASQFAQDLKAGSLGDIGRRIHVRSVQCADLLASTAIVGEAENLLTEIFGEAEREATVSNGSLVILDDVHLICPRRGGSGGLGVDQLAGTLLALLDGIGRSKKTAKGGFVVLAITTDPSLLDPALRRSGRLDSEIEVSVPDDKARNDILRFHISQLVSQQENTSQPDLRDLPSVQPCIGISNKELESLARLAKGFTGADCKLAVKEAVRINIRRVGYRDVSNSKRPNLEGSKLSIEYIDLEHAIRSTKPSAIKSVAVEVPHVPWSAIGGMNNVKSLLRESIELPLTHPHLFEMMQVPPPKGILLYGPPGCSKTLMARAIATEGQMNFLAVKGPELLSKWLGESERALASLFRRARLASPSVIFFDEIDAIALKRGEGGGGGGDRLLSQLLTELDGVTGTGKKCRVVVAGATNRPDVLDPALTRPGRMDRMIYVGLPDSAGRKQIFEIGLKGKACHQDVDVSVFARCTIL